MGDNWVKVVAGFQKTMLYCIHLFGKLGELVDIDKDGDLDMDDWKLLYDAQLMVVANAQEHYGEWKKLNEGERINYIIKEMKELYPKVDPKVWYILNAILWVGATYLKKTGLSFSITDLKMLKGK